jgi:hypothetical protein
LIGNHCQADRAGDCRQEGTGNQSDKSYCCEREKEKDYRSGVHDGL